MHSDLLRDSVIVTLGEQRDKIGDDAPRNFVFGPTLLHECRVAGWAVRGHFRPKLVVHHIEQDLQVSDSFFVAFADRNNHQFGSMASMGAIRNNSWEPDACTENCSIACTAKLI